MRTVGLGQWLYYVWHLPTMLAAAGAAGLAFFMFRSLYRDALHPATRQRRWALAGWASVAASLLALIAWPYLRAVETVQVAPDGTWILSNYLGMTLATIPPDERRAFRGRDLGGLRWGAGHVEIVRTDGRTYGTVRINGDTFNAFCDTLGYTRGMLRSWGSDVAVAAHVYTPWGPVLAVAVASR
jgi:hypothetical protein